MNSDEASCGDCDCRCSYGCEYSGRESAGHGLVNFKLEKKEFNIL